MVNVNIGSISVGDGSPLLLIAGPCVIESEDLCTEVAERVSEMASELGIGYVFKSSFDKANRTSFDSYRGPGLDEGLRVLAAVRERCGVPVLTDVHESGQVDAVAQVADVIQIPAFLCRQTDILLAAGRTGKPVQIKKGQFMSPQLMKYAAEKVKSAGSRNILLCERGTFFGYGDLVSDMRSMILMRETGYPVIYDATHSVQRPGGMGAASGGDARLAEPLALAALAAGADGLFVEVHPDPQRALSDAATVMPLKRLRRVIERALAVYKVSRKTL